MILIPNRTNFTAIVVQTRLGHDIQNSQLHEVRQVEENQFVQLKSRFRDVRYCTPINPTYNCHGMTFASKRTWVYQTSDIHTILNEDGYTEVKPSADAVMPGDILLYFAQDGDIEHSATVLSWSKTDVSPLVLSKWGIFTEVVHWAHVTPYVYSYAKYFRITKWT
jgi:hypothetical protein